MRLYLIAGLRAAFFLYLQLLVTHAVLQHHYASEHRRSYRSRRCRRPAAAPAVDVVIPCYNEDPQLLEACCASLDDQDYNGTLRVFLVDDGSSNLGELAAVYKRYTDPAPHRGGQARWQVILLAEHVGKRRAQDTALRHCEGELVMTIDSDTTVGVGGISKLVAAFGDPRVGAVTGRIGVHNAARNRLTRTIEQLYWLLFEQERAAQARFHSVLCCSGPFSVYRRSALDRRWADYLNQRVCGRECVSGDDLHLTVLILADGHLALYEPGAVADTHVPVTVRHFLRQQLRWWRSFYRELGWIGSAIRDRHWYLAFDIAARGLPPLLLASTLVLAAVEGLLIGPGAGLRDLSLVVMLVLAYGSFAAGQARDLRYFRAGLVVALLVPLQLYALLTCVHSSWGRREPRCLVESAGAAARPR